MTQRNETRIRLRVYRRERLPDSHGGFSQVWHGEEERWGVLTRVDRFLPSSEAIHAVEAGALPPKRALYTLRMRCDPARRPFERFSWKGDFYALLSEEVIPCRKGYDFFWVCREKISGGQDHV